ncbi:MAG: hypothetical protein MR384_09345 [Lachnospiraceae bacterium]|nr:hypothetical protein [Lachnospiraceae bacterium]
MKNKRIVSVILIITLLVSLSIPSQSVSAKSKLLCKDKNIEIYFKQVKKGKIYLTYKNKSSKNLDVDITFMKINGKSYYNDWINEKTVVSKETRNVKVVVYDEDGNEINYKFKKGKISGQFKYSSDDGKIYGQKLNFKNKNVG